MEFFATFLFFFGLMMDLLSLFFSFSRDPLKLDPTPPAKWEPKVLGMNKRDLLQEVLPILGSSLQKGVFFLRVIDWGFFFLSRTRTFALEDGAGLAGSSGEDRVGAGYVMGLLLDSAGAVLFVRSAFAACILVCMQPCIHRLQAFLFSFPMTNTDTAA